MDRWTREHVVTKQVDMWTSGPVHKLFNGHRKVDGWCQWSDGRVDRWTGEHVEMRKVGQVEYRSRLKGGGGE